MVCKGKTHSISGSSVIVLALVLFVGVAIFNGIAKQTSQESSESPLGATPTGKAYGRVFFPAVESNVEGESIIIYPEMIGPGSSVLNRESGELIDSLERQQVQEILRQETQGEPIISTGYIIELKDPPLLALTSPFEAEPGIQLGASQIPPSPSPSSSEPVKGVKGRTRSLKKPIQPPSAQMPLEQEIPIPVPEQLFSDEEITERHQSARSKILRLVESTNENPDNPPNPITGNAVAGATVQVFAELSQPASKGNGQQRQPVVLGDYLLAFNGFALDISEEEAINLLELPEVKAVFPNYEVQEVLMDSVPLIHADEVWRLDAEGNDCNMSGRECLTGKGATIGIIDTGVDYTHPDLGGCLSGKFEKKTINEIPISTAPGVQNNPSVYGDKVVWESSSNGASYNIFMFDLRTNETKQITSDNKSISPAIYGDKVVWAQNGQIYLFDITSGKTIQISNSTESFAGTPWIFEDKVVWAGRSLTSNIASYDIYLHDLGSQDERKLTKDLPPAFRSAPRIFGDNIVWVEATSGYKLTMFLYSLLSGVGRNITGFPVDPPGTNSLYIYKGLVVWSDNRNGNPDIFLLNLSSNEERQITFDNSSQVHPSIYENKIVWVDSRELGEIYMFDLDKNEEHRITYREDSWQAQPFIYKDLVVWTDSRGGYKSYDIYMANLSMPNGTYLQEASPKGCKVAGGYDFVNRDDDPMDDRGHGTHVAATAAGNGLLKGVAPGALIYAYKVLDGNGRGSASDIISAIEASVDPNKDGNTDDHLDVISLSLGRYCGQYSEGCGPGDPMSKAIDNAVSAGVVAVVAAGNNGPNGLVGSPGIAKKAITVGAANTTGPTPTIAKFSSRGSYGSSLKPDVVAPGVRICAARFDSYAPGNECFDRSHIAISGTSMATPHVAGIVALMKQKSKSADVEGWSPEGVKSALRATAVPIGNIPVKQGWGLVDAAAAVKLPHLPCSAAMDPLPPTASGTITLSAKISCNRPIKKWEFSYAKNDQIIVSDAIQVSRGPSEPAAIEWDTSSVDDGQYWIKIRVEDDAGLIAEDAIFLKLENVYLSSPMSNDVLRAGDFLEIKGTAIGGPSSSYTLEYARGVDKAAWVWKASGITLAGGGKANIKDGILGSWDTSGITAPDFYTLRLVVNTNNGLNTDHSFFMYLDPRLKKGWPVRIPFAYSVFTDDKMDVKPVDIDGDGTKELIILDKATHGSGEAPKLLAYGLDGALRWKKEFPKPSWISLPFFGQKDSSGESAIYIVSSEGYPNLDLLHKLDAQGNEAPGWPAELMGLFWEGMVADLDRDGKSEIILKSLGGIANGSMAPFNFLNVWDEGGKLISKAKIPMCQNGWSERSKHAAIGNFDDDMDLEIATHHGCTAIAAYNKDGSLVPGSVRDTGAMLWASLASGDINNDGIDEIVAAGSNLFEGYSGGVYVFGKDGLLKGWPQFTDRAFTASPALGDVNGDGFLDIAISDWGGFTHVLDYQGKELPGWPRKNEIWPWSYRDTSLAIADINGDNKADIISRGGGIQPALLQGGKMNSLGGIFAWNADGSPIGLNPVYPSNSLVMELWNGAPPVVTDLDNNGRVDIIGSSVAESAMCPLESD
ncbi:S8 family serine peptidase, partial [Candidatus Woesearchaeota archaeon]|nr:S8 family serine peptidase [Candidatus Woesearchaeota archaeon]